VTRRKKKRGGALRSLLLVAFGLLAGAGLYLAHDFGLLRLPSFPRGGPAEAPTAERTPAPPEPTPQPKRADATPTPAPRRRVPARPPSDFESAASAGDGVIALVLDDIGFEDGSLARLAALSGPLALAVIPSAPRAKEAAALAKKKGWDLLIHLPMAPVDGPGELDAIGPLDDDATIVKRVSRALTLVPGAIGLNNHQGSKATADERVVRTMLGVVKDRGLFFLDSRTTPATVAEDEARRLGVSTVARDVFLDDAGEEARAKGGADEAIHAAFTHALAVAKKKGQCVVIGHPHKATLAFLETALPELDATTVKRVKVSELVD
jgi:hypothetical protein